MSLKLSARAALPLLWAVLAAVGPAGAARAEQPGSAPEESAPAAPEVEPAAEPDKESTEEPAWEFRIGMIGGIAPKWQGSDSYRFRYAPNYSVVWRDRLFVKNESAGVNLIKSKTFDAGLIARRGPGRGNPNDLEGLDDVDDGVEVGGVLEFDPGPISFHLAYYQDVASGHGGSLGVLGASTKVTLVGSLEIRARAEATLASGDYMDAFFGVDAEGAAKSGLDRFDAGAGFKDVGLIVGTGYEITEHWTLALNLTYRRLVGDAADSPIVRDRGSPHQFRAGLGLFFNF